MRMVALAVLLAAACGIPSEGPAMRPGEDCVDCHARGDGDPRFTAAGTLYANAGDSPSNGVEGARVHLIDSAGRTVSLSTNEVGNFYTRERLTFPIAVAVEGKGLVAVMKTPAPDGGCNRCHTLPPPATELPAAAGRVALTGGLGDEFMLPGFDCLSCHRAGGLSRNVPFGAAGTVFITPDGGAGDEAVFVLITDDQGRVFQGVTNRVGNFNIPVPIAFGPNARVQIVKGGVTRAMRGPLTHGSCNRCHRRGGEDDPVSLLGDED